MRGAICYFSGTGNTALACRYVASGLEADFDLIDITRHETVDLGGYDVVGFGTYTDFWGVPELLTAFIAALPRRSPGPAFVFNTYAGISGQTLRILSEAVTAAGFDVFASHSLRMPQSHPLLIGTPLDSPRAPDTRAMAGLDGFVASLRRGLETLRDGRAIEPVPARVGLVDGMIPKRLRDTGLRTFGGRRVDEAACTACGTCARGCPYGAITLDARPVFDLKKCEGCWRCYNRCPNRAIHTGLRRRSVFYPGPSEELRRTLSPRPRG